MKITHSRIGGVMTPTVISARLQTRAYPPKGEFKNRRKRRSRRGNEAEVFFAPKSTFYSENEI